VIANAGMSQMFPRVEDAKTGDLLKHYHVNVISVVMLFRAVLPLLQRSRSTLKFAAMSSETGTVGDQERFDIPNAVYGPTKAAVNWLLKKIHLENDTLIAFPAHPGSVFSAVAANSPLCSRMLTK
jgi:norsolorinic acid ketoreductase